MATELAASGMSPDQRDAEWQRSLTGHYSALTSAQLKARNEARERDGNPLLKQKHGSSRNSFRRRGP